MINSNRIVPRISFKGVFIFMLFLLIGLLVLPTPFMQLGLSKLVSYFIACAVSSSIGSILVLTKIDATSTDKPLFKKRVILSIIVGLVSSGLIIFVFGGDIFGY
ncbi:MAG: hypothetical protein ACQEWU_08140 [Bacillota bacterium]|uniref:hypothetical protein n=1 Tax=Virgibacillus TaxID=84406 RepID=UPI001D16C4FE|nr:MULTISPECIES: hypothetical protein [Virgibacillus]MCC2252403.1 hypothetical protein [Virgibacillus sp. AGTR]MDY7042796.1 hypothetical protein [Virgibacillus sp. M23]WBX78574.1 hypothetical protein PD280_11760 [Virgibacillus salarius]